MLIFAGYTIAASTLVTAILTVAAIRLGFHWGVLDYPGERKLHPDPVPLSGGWSAYAAFTVLTWTPLLCLWSTSDAGISALQGLPGLQPIQAWAGLAPHFIARFVPVFVSATGIFLLGLWDDRKGVAPWIRLTVTFGAGLALSLGGLRPHLAFLPTALEIAVGAFWIAGITNAFNLIDGMDGLCAGVSATATLALLFISLIFQQPLVMLLCAVLLGTQIGFLCFNTPPAKIFLGSSGSLLWGHLLAIVSVLVIYSSPSLGVSNRLAPLVCPLLLLAVPIYDTTSVVLIRLREGRPIVRGDRSHFHHRLLRVGFSERQVLFFICAVSCLGAISAVLLTEAGPLQTALLLAQSGAVFFLIALSEGAAARNSEKARRMIGLSEERKNSSLGSGSPR